MNLYPEINIEVLRREVKRWSARFSSIKTITLYPHKGGHPNDSNKKFFLDLCLDQDTPQTQAAEIEGECSPIDSSLFFEEILSARSHEDSYQRENFEIWSRREKDILPIQLISDTAAGVVLFLRPENSVFPELNLDFLKIVASRWAEKYNGRGVSFDRIVLYHYASDYQKEIDKALTAVVRRKQQRGINKDYSSEETTITPKYAIVFEIQSYERQSEPWLNETPYENFISDTEYFSTIPEKPTGLIYSDFSGVYGNRAPDQFYKEWAFIPQYKGFALNDNARVDEGFVVLYDSRQKHESHLADTTKAEKQGSKAKINFPPIDDTVGNITISYESDSEISVQQTGKQKRTVAYDNLNFRKPTGITWRKFLEVLQTPPNHYWVCPNNRDLQQLKEVSEKLIRWLSTNLKISFPSGYKLFE